MSKSEQRRDTNIGGLDWRYLLVLCSIIFVSWSVYAQYHSQEREKAAHKDQETAINACLDRPTVELFQYCLTTAKNADYRTSASQYDLKAQQDMSEWAFLMLAVTSLGVFYVALTLRETSAAAGAAVRAADIAQEIGEAQARAYLAFSRLEYRHNIAYRLPHLILTIQNAGNSPATVEELTATIDYSYDKYGGEIKSTSPCKPLASPSIPGQGIAEYEFIFTWNIVDGDQNIHGMMADPTRVFNIFAEVSLIGRDVFGSKITGNAKFSHTFRGNEATMRDLSAQRRVHDGEFVEIDWYVGKQPKHDNATEH